MGRMERALQAGRQALSGMIEGRGASALELDVIEEDIPGVLFHSSQRWSLSSGNSWFLTRIIALGSSSTGGWMA